MDAYKFGGFIASLRKEKGMTQADLARKLQVTDKAVSRWERGQGFPDIHSLEPLSKALDISLVELMNSERSPGGMISQQEASEALVQTVDMARREQRKRSIRKAIVLGSVLLAAVCLWMLLTGMSLRKDVYIGEFSVLPSGRVMTIHTSVASSMGYTRDCKDVSDSPQRAELRFYSAFGGLNSALGAQDVFLIYLAPECTEIYVERFNGIQLVLQKNEETGQWERVS